MSFGEEGHLRDGTTPIEVATFLAELGADIVGVNCDQGPALVFDAACAMLPVGLPVSAQPNAGVPRRLDQRLIYMATPEYFGVYARRMFMGAQGVGPLGLMEADPLLIQAEQKLIGQTDERPLSQPGEGQSALAPASFACWAW